MFGLRSDIGKHTGVTTTIESDMERERDLERGEKGENHMPKMPIQGSSRKQSFGKTRQGEWTDESKLTDMSSDDERPNNWAGIRKTTVQTRFEG